MYYFSKNVIFCLIIIISITKSEFVIDSQLPDNSQYISINEFNVADLKCKDNIEDIIESNDSSERKRVFKKKEKIISISNSEGDSHSWDF